MAVTGELETTDEADNTDSDSNQSRCPYCGYIYAQHPAAGCAHLLCVVDSVQSNNALVVADDHPLVATLFGLEVPRVVAGRFMHFLRSQPQPQPQLHNGAVDSHVHTDPPNTNARAVRTTDLMVERRALNGVVTIKHSQEDSTSFKEWTYYLTAQPASSMRTFASFVQKQYCPSHVMSVSGDDAPIPFDRIKLYQAAGLVTLDVADLFPNLYEAGKWVMLTGMPDDLPLFFFAVTTPTPDQAVLFINHSTSLSNRMKNWDTFPTYTSLFPLSRLPPLIIN